MLDGCELHRDDLKGRWRVPKLKILQERLRGEEGRSTDPSGPVHCDPLAFLCFYFGVGETSAFQLLAEREKLEDLARGRAAL